MASAFLAARLPGYDNELNRAELDIASLESRCQSYPADVERRIRLAYRLFHRASMTGVMDHFDQMEAAVAKAIADFGPREDICLLKANLDLRFHRLPEVRGDLEMCPLLPSRFEARVLLTDLDFQEGRYEEARLQLERLIHENRTWDNIARLAHWKSKLGDPEEADTLYAEAENDLTAKQMRSFAWLELQRGVLALTHGEYEDAWNHYRMADASYPGHWHTDEHFAELLAAEGRLDDAAALLQKVIARAPKPELKQALGELYVFSGQPGKAEPWFDEALETYLKSVACGGVHYYHHLADFYADAREEPSEAVRYARMDLAMRSNFSTQAALAWALYRNGQIPEAVEYMRMALSSGVRDARILSTAATLFEAGGYATEVRRYSAAASEINPLHDRFHMHH